MLYGIPKTFTPDLLKMMMALGHGERLLICDGNFPYQSRAKETVFITNIRIPDLMDEILRFYPLDHAVDKPAVIMDGAIATGTLAEYQNVIHEYRKEDSIETVGRFDFYDLADEVQGIVVTNDDTKFGNIILQKGIIVDN